MTVFILVVYLALLALRVWLMVLNLQHRRRHGGKVPPEFEGRLDPAALHKSSLYHADREKVAVLHMLVMAGVVVYFLFAGGLLAYDRLMANWIGSEGLRGVVFFAGLLILSSLLDLPFDAHVTFRIEQRHGFNRTTVGLFFADWLKGTLLSTVLLSVLAALGLGLLRVTPNWYWLWFWVLGVAFFTLLMFVSPYVIEPLFIKTKPLSREDLARAVQQLAERAGVKVTSVLEVDASRRSSHSNAYFTGIGRVKRVVLFDTLLQRLADAEILGVLGHELGHWKLGHVKKRLFGMAALALLGLFLASRWLAWPEGAALLGLSQASLFARLTMLGFLGSLLGELLSPLSMLWSRHHEWQADAFATQLTGQPQDLASALTRLAEDNLTNLFPHPWYAAVHHSHPPAVERVRRLRESPHSV